MAHQYEGIIPFFRINALKTHNFSYAFIRGGIGDGKSIFEYESQEYIGNLRKFDDPENKNDLKINLLRLMEEHKVVFSKYHKNNPDESVLLTFKDIINHPEIQDNVKNYLKLYGNDYIQTEESSLKNSLNIDYTPKKFFELDHNKLQVFECEKKQSTNYEYHIQKPFIDAFPIELKIIQSPLSNRNIKYKIIWESKSLAYSIPTEGNPKSIINQLSENGLILNDYKSSDKFAFILSFLRKQGFMETDYGIQEAGFHWLDGRIVPVKYDCEDLPRPDDLKRSLEILEDFGNCFLTDNVDLRDKVATIFKSTLINPFDFVKKLLGYDREIPFLYGAPGTAKTTLLQLPKFVYELSDDYFMESGGAAGSESRLSGLMKDSTFPKMVDEAENIFKNPSLVALNKQSINSSYSRKIRDTNQKEHEQPSFSTLLYNSNQSPFKHSQDGSVRRYQIINFDETGKPSEDEKNYFREKWGASDKGHFQKDTPLTDLKYIGKFVAFKIVNNPDLLRKDVKSLTDGLIRDMYMFAGISGGPSTWLLSWCEIEDENAFKQMENEKIIYFMRKSIENAHRYKIQEVNEDYRPENTFEDENYHGPGFYFKRMDEVANNPALPWFDYKRIKGADYYIINQGFNQELHKETGLSLTTSELNNRFVIFEYKPTRFNNGKVIRVIRVLKKEFCNLLYGHLEKQVD